MASAPVRNVYVAGLPPSFDDAQLLELVCSRGCARSGVESLKCVMDPRTRLCRGYGFVLFVDATQAMLAVQALDGQLVTCPTGMTGDAYQLQVRPAHPSAQPTKHDITSRSATKISTTQPVGNSPNHNKLQLPPPPPPPPTYIQTLGPNVLTTPSATPVMMISSNNLAVAQMQMPHVQVISAMPHTVQMIPTATSSHGHISVTTSTPQGGESTMRLTPVLTSTGDSSAAVATASSYPRENMVSSPQPQSIFLADNLFTSSSETPLFSASAAALPTVTTTNAQHNSTSNMGSSLVLQQQQQQQQQQHAAAMQTLGLSFSNLHLAPGVSSPGSSLSNVFDGNSTQHNKSATQLQDDSQQSHDVSSSASQQHPLPVSHAITGGSMWSPSDSTAGGTANTSATIQAMASPSVYSSSSGSVRFVAAPPTQTTPFISPIQMRSANNGQILSMPMRYQIAVPQQQQQQQQIFFQQQQQFQPQQQQFQPQQQQFQPQQQQQVMMMMGMMQPQYVVMQGAHSPQQQHVFFQQQQQQQQQPVQYVGVPQQQQHDMFASQTGASYLSSIGGGGR